MSEWPGDPGDPDNQGDPSEADRIDLDGDAEGDLDEALQEAVEAVEAAGRRAPAQPQVVDEDAIETAEVDSVEAVRAELEDLRQRSARTLADFDNYRKRVDREAEVQRRYDGMEVLRGLLDIVDNLERALASDGPVADLKTGVELTLRQAEALMRRHGVDRIEAEEATFDPAVHEAVSREVRPGLAEPQVTAVLQPGYRMHDRLLRPVRVTVAVPPPAPEGGEGER